MNKLVGLLEGNEVKDYLQPNLLAEYQRLFEQHHGKLVAIRTGIERLLQNSRSDEFTQLIASAKELTEAAQKDIKAFKALMLQYGYKVV